MNHNILNLIALAFLIFNPILSAEEGKVTELIGFEGKPVKEAAIHGVCRGRAMEPWSKGESQATMLVVWGRPF